MKTINQKRRIVVMQYALESLIEQYNDAEVDSEKYIIELKLLDFVEEYEYTPTYLINYMRLNEDKFMPFIKLLLDVKDSNNNNKTKIRKTHSEPNVIVHIMSDCIG